MINLLLITLKQNNKEAKPKQSCQVHTKQKTTTHKTQMKKDNLYMILNQRQR